MRQTCLANPVRFLIPAFALSLIGSGPGSGVAQDQKPGGARASNPQGAPITIEVDGWHLSLHHTRGTVADALKAAKVELGEADECSPAATERLQPGMTITVHRVVTTTTTETVKVPFKTKVLPTRRLRRGLTMISQHPQEGLKEITARVTTRDGEVISEQVLSQKVLRPAKDKVILVGGSEAVLPSRGGYFTGRRELVMRATAYEPSPASCGPGNGGRTYLGWKAQRGIAAVDPRVIPLGAHLWVEGYGECVAADIGSAIKGNRIDLCFPTMREVRRYGVKMVKVRILSD